MITKEQYLEAIEICKKYREQLREELAKSDFIEREEFYTDDTRLREINISVRLLNVLKEYYWKKNPDFDYFNITMSDIKKISLKELWGQYSFGKKTHEELKEILSKIH